MSKKRLPSLIFLWMMVGVSFSLAIFDMFFLRDVFNKNLGFDIVGASIMSVSLAFAADVAALIWGRQKGLRDSWKSFKWGWIALGVAYMAIRSVSFVEDVIIDGDYSYESIMGQVIPVIVLTISYIGTGTMLQWAGSKIWDLDAVNFREAKKVFKESHAKVIKNHAAILEMAKRLDEFDKNYDSLNHQYNIHMDKIRKNEHSVMSLIVAKTIADNPEIIDSPSEADNVMKKVLEERDRKNERAHFKQK